MEKLFKEHLWLIVLRQRRISLWLICTLFFVLGLLRVSDRSLLTPDSCQYLIWGNSLAHVQGFVDNTTPEPDKFVNHGPLYPVLIAPVEIIFPLSVSAVKVWTLFFGVAVIILFYFLFLRFFEKPTALIATVFFAFNPMLLLYSTEILSDVPFVAAILASFIFTFKLQEQSDKQNQHFILLIVSIASAILLREIGLSLVAVFVLIYLWKKDWKRAFVIAGSVVLVLGLWNIRNHILVEKTVFSQTGNSPWVFDHIMTSPDTSFLVEIIVRIWHNLKVYSNFLFGMMFYPTFATQQLSTIFNEASWVYQSIKQIFDVGKYFIFLITIPSFTFGIITILQNSITPSFQTNNSPSHLRTSAPLLLFIPTYLLILCVFPFNDMRYMLPLVPFLLFFCLIGLKNISERLHLFDLLNRKSFVIILSLVLLIPNVISTSEMIRHNIRSNKSNALPWNELGTWIQQNTSSDCIIASPIKDLALVTGGERKVFTLYPNIEVPKFEFSLRDYQADYLLSPHSYEDATMFEMNMIESSRFSFEHVYSAGNLHLYKIHSLLKEPSYKKFNVENTTSISGFLVSTRRYILQGHYEEAEKLLDTIVALSPSRPDILFQRLVCSALQEDLGKAQQVYQQLTAFPSDVGIYIQPAQRQLDVLRLLQEARTSSSEEIRSIKTLKAVSAYWNLGYYNRASSLINKLFTDSTQYFEGLLWGTHFAIQRGDFTQAKYFHRQLWMIDSLNTLVRSYQKILAWNDSLVTDTSSESRSLRHLALARIYHSIELREEALDEAERSIGCNAGNNDAHALLATIKERNNAGFSMLVP